MGEHHINFPIKLFQFCLDSSLDGRGGLLVRPPASPIGAIHPIDAICAANGNRPYAIQVIDLAIFCEQDMAEVLLDIHRPLAPGFLVIGRYGFGTAFVVAMDAKQCDGQLIDLLLLTTIDKAAAEVDPGVAENDHHVTAAGFHPFTELSDTPKLSMRITG